MPVHVRVRSTIDYDPSVVAQALGEEPLALEHRDRVLAPFITLDGRIHRSTSYFLHHHCLSRPNSASASRIASDLASWLDFLCNHRGLPPYEDHRDPVLAATEDDFAAYYRRRQYGDAEQVLTPDGWGRAASSIKRLYEQLQGQHQHKPPFDIVAFTGDGRWQGTTIARYRPRRRNTGSAGTPLTPEFAQLLLLAALRVDLNGQQDEYQGADRDHALISLGLATGLRRNNLANITIYELPPPSPLPITTMHVADQITKGDAGGDTLVFSHYLPGIWNYVEGSRAELITRTRYKPLEPLEIVDATSTKVRFRDPDSQDPITRRWARCDEQFRRRLVTVEGTSPVLFLNELNGEPLAYRSLQHSIEGARTFARDRLHADFPIDFRLHDLRHTYAVHLTLAIYRDVIADSIKTARRGDWTVDHIGQAVELVKLSLGHASQASTQLYIQTAHRFLNIPLEHFVGKP